MRGKKIRRSINISIYGAPIQSNPIKTLPCSLRNNIKDLIRTGTIYVIPAGDYGPLPGTINPFAKFREAIVVGGARNDGGDLCSFSSRGIPGVDFSGPTIVCPSENLIGKTHSGITPVIQNQGKLEHLFTRERIENQNNRKITDAEWKYAKERFVIGTGTSQAVEYLVNIIICIVHFRNQRSFVSDQKAIRRILVNMGMPIKGYKNYEVGAGFVNYQIADDYLKRVDKGLIEPNEQLYWSKNYFDTRAKNGKIRLGWVDNINDVNQIDFTKGDNSIESKGGFGPGEII